MIKTTILTERNKYRTCTFFRKYIAENGNAVCTINGEVVEPNAGNDIYRKMKAEGAASERVVVDASNNEIIALLESGIDKYVQYIDNYRQYEEACRSNDKIRKVIAEFKKVAEA